MRLSVVFVCFFFIYNLLFICNNRIFVFVFFSFKHPLLLIHGYVLFMFLSWKKHQSVLRKILQFSQLQKTNQPCFQKLRRQLMMLFFQVVLLERLCKKQSSDQRYVTFYGTFILIVKQHTFISMHIDFSYFSINVIIYRKFACDFN